MVEKLYKFSHENYTNNALIRKIKLKLERGQYPDHVLDHIHKCLAELEAKTVPL